MFHIRMYSTNMHYSLLILSMLVVCIVASDVVEDPRVPIIPRSEHDEGGNGCSMMPIYVCTKT
jgi:hypothetical protein